MRKILFDFEARLEFESAISHYNAKKPGLGDRFENEVYAILDRVAENPGRFRTIGATVRVARLKVFEKYAVYFSAEPERINVVSVFHASRDPSDLRRRLR